MQKIPDCEARVESTVATVNTSTWKMIVAESNLKSCGTLCMCPSPIKDTLARGEQTTKADGDPGHTITFLFLDFTIHHWLTFTIPLCLLGAAYAYQSCFPPGEQEDVDTTTTTIITMTDDDADKNLPDVVRAEEKKDDTDDPLHTGQDNLLMLESEDIEAKQDGVWKKLWDSMNPSACLAPATACTNVLLDDETVEYNTIVPPMLRDIDHPGKQRTLGLQRLYRFTDRERQKNRYVDCLAMMKYATCTEFFLTLRPATECLSSLLPDSIQWMS